MEYTIDRSGPGASGFDPDHLTALLHTAARAGAALTYAEALNALGHPFSRPRMRALCKLLDDIDTAERGAGRPPLACLVVRASDRLPGQGWWVGRRDYDGTFTGPAAAAYLARHQAAAFAYWAVDRADDFDPATGPAGRTNSQLSSVERALSKR